MDAALRAFGQLLRASEPEIDLGFGALLVASVEHPDLVPEIHMKRLDELADRSGAAGIADPVHGLHRLREFLFEEEGFRGNSSDYYDPRNSCLNDVLSRKLGIPISLSVLMIEVGRRVGLRIAGIGLPGHFVVSAEVGPEPVLLDPFDGGSVLTAERASDLVARALGLLVPLTECNFRAVTKCKILTRMLLNLRGVYARTGEWAKALGVVDRLLLLDEGCAGHVRDRGSILVRLGQERRGAADWESYLDRCPQAADAESVRRELRRVRQRHAALN